MGAGRAARTSLVAASALLVLGACASHIRPAAKAETETEMFCYNTTSFTAAQSNIAIHVDSLRSGEGTVRIALYEEAADFPKKGKGIRTVSVPASADGVDAIIEGLGSGTYAVTMFHDENDNEDFDQMAFGLPREGFGFSNDAPTFLSPPRFEDAAFPVGGDGTCITVHMRYLTASSETPEGLY